MIAAGVWWSQTSRSFDASVHGVLRRAFGDFAMRSSDWRGFVSDLERALTDRQVRVLRAGRSTSELFSPEEVEHIEREIITRFVVSTNVELHHALAEGDIRYFGMRARCNRFADLSQP